MEDTNAFSTINELIVASNNMEDSGKNSMNEQMSKLIQDLPIFKNSKKLFAENSDSSNQSNDVDEMVRVSKSTEEQTPQTKNTPATIKGEGWYECFSTSVKSEYDALIYSLYVIEKEERKNDGWKYYECINRLQNKCRFKVRTKMIADMYLIEEKAGHNHGIETSAHAGSHAGLPKTIREIVDKSFNEGWISDLRDHRINEEIKRLGLPKNPRLGRQIDNRLSYLKRVKNLNESRRAFDEYLQTATDNEQTPGTKSLADTYPEMLSQSALENLIKAVSNIKENDALN